jgi:hypothetical protein
MYMIWYLGQIWEGLRVYKFDTNYVLWGTTPPKEAPTNCVGSLEQVVNEFIVYGEYLVYIYYLMIRKHNNLGYRTTCKQDQMQCQPIGLELHPVCILYNI